jgi:formiminotetrahydrofolate cyclodeaminase
VLPPADFITALAADSPAPGGGSAAAYTGALGAALVGMTARLTLGRKKYAGVENEMQAIAVQSDSLRQELLVSVERDAAAFEEVMLALRLPKESDDERRVRDNAVQEATLKATLVPLGVIRRISEVLELAARAAESGNLNAITDVGTGAELALAALRGASLNVQVNLTSLADPQTVSAFKTELSTLEKNAEDSIGRVRAALATRGGLSPA